MIKFIKNKKISSISLLALVMIGTLGANPAISGSFRFSDFTFKRQSSKQTKFHKTRYSNGKKGVDAFQQFVQKESQALNLSQLNARKLDTTKLNIKYDVNDLKIYFINEGAGYRNQLKLVTTGTTRKNGLIFMDGSKGGGSRELRLGDFVKVGKIKSGTTLDFQLRANGYDAKKQESKPDSKVNTWYVDTKRNKDNLQHVIAYEYEGYLILGWEDLYNGGDKDYNDIVFAVDIGQRNLDEIPDEPPANQVPQANADSAKTPSGQRVTINVTANDVDPDGDAITVKSVTDDLSEGKVTISSDKKKVIYTPKSGHVGSDSFSYTAVDSKGATDVATVSVTVEAVKQPPEAQPDTVSTPNNRNVTIDVLNNDSNPENDTLTITVSNPPHGTAEVENGKVIYTPDSNYINGTDSFEYTIEDSIGNTSTATVTVNVTDGAPLAVDDNPTTYTNTAITINVLDNDSDPDNTQLTINSLNTINDTTGITSNTIVTTNGRAVITNNRVVYTPNSEFTGTDSFTYSILDASGNPDRATVSVTVSPIVYAD